MRPLCQSFNTIFDTVDRSGSPPCAISHYFTLQLWLEDYYPIVPLPVTFQTSGRSWGHLEGYHTLVQDYFSAPNASRRRERESLPLIKLHNYAQLLPGPKQVNQHLDAICCRMCTFVWYRMWNPHSKVTRILCSEVNLFDWQRAC